MKNYKAITVSSQTFDEKEIESTIPEPIVNSIANGLEQNLDKEIFNIVGPFIDFETGNKISFGVMRLDERDEDDFSHKYRITVEKIL